MAGIPEPLARLGFCNCGDPELGYAALREVLAAHDTRDAAGGWDAKCRRFKAWSTVRDYRDVLLLLYFLDAAGLTEHGGSVHCGWLSADGYLVLDFLNEHGTDLENWEF